MDCFRELYVFQYYLSTVWCRQSVFPVPGTAKYITLEMLGEYSIKIVPAIAPDLYVKREIDVHRCTLGLFLDRNSATRWLTAEWIRVKHVRK